MLRFNGTTASGTLYSRTGRCSVLWISLVLAIVTYIKDASCASFSKVFVQNGPDYPVEYVQYGAPSVSYSPQIAQLTAAPVGSIAPYSSNYVPCGTPCIYPGQVAPVAPSANIVQYQAPSLPVVVAPSRNEPSGYEYSYVVYDEQTGDHKAQRELSDGSLVRGGYSFLQPDGFVREVQYVADDVQGFNAVVKNYLPVTVENKKHDHAGKPEVAPCHEVKDDQIKVDETHHKTSEEHGHEDHHKEPSHENLKAHQEEHHAEATEHSKPEQPHIHETHEENHETHAEPTEKHKEQKEEHLEHHKIHEEPQKEHQEVHEEHHEAHAETLEKQHEEHHEGHEAHVEPHEEHHEPKTEPLEELIVVIEEHHDEPHGAHHEVRVEHHTEETHETHAPEHQEEVHEQPHEEHEASKSHAEPIQEVIKSSESHIEPEVHEHHEQHLAGAEHDVANSNVLVPYDDIIRCVQGALSGVNEAASPRKAESPLTYIILNKPC